MAFIRPPASACVIFNETHHILYTPYSNTPGEEVYDDTSTLLPTTEEYIPNSSVISNSVSESDTLVTNQNFRFKRGLALIIRQYLIV